MIENIINTTEHLNIYNNNIDIFRRYLMDNNIYSSFPSVETIQTLNNIIPINSNILEICAGCGQWSKYLSIYHNIITTDIDIPNIKFVNIEKLSAYKAVKKYGNKVNVLFVSWSKNEPTENTMQYFKGDYVIVVGEINGCTHAGIFNDIDILDWELLHTIKLLTPPGLYGNMYIYGRKK